MNKRNDARTMRHLVILLAVLSFTVTASWLLAGPPLPDDRQRGSATDDEKLEQKLLLLGERYVDLIDELEDILGEYEDFFQDYGRTSMKEYEKAIQLFRESLREQHLSDRHEEQLSAVSRTKIMEKLDELVDRLESIEQELENKETLQSRDIRNLRSLGYDLEDVREELHENLAEVDLRMDIDSEELSRAIARAYREAARAMAEARKEHEKKRALPIPPVPPVVSTDQYQRLKNLYVTDFSATLTQQETARLDSKDITIELENPIGGITVRTWNKSEMDAVLTVGYSQGSKKSRDVAEEIKLVLKESPTLAGFLVQYPDEDGERVKIVSSLLEVSLPRANPVRISNSFGPVSVTELDNRLNVASGFSTIDLQKIKGDVTVNNSSGSVYLENITGRIDISSSFGPIEVVYLEGDAILSNSYAPTMVKKSAGRLDINTSGLVTINNHKGDADIQSSNGEMDLYAITGNLTAINSFGRVRVEDVGGDADIENANAAMEIARIGGRLTVSNKFAPISIDDVRKDVTAKSSNGPVTVNNVKGNLDIVNRFGGVTVEAVGGTVRIVNANAPVAVSDVLAPVSVVNLFGPVYIAGVAGDVEVDNQNASVDLVDIEGAAKVSTTFGLITGENLGGPFLITNNNGSVELTRVMQIPGDCEVTTTFGDIILELPKSKSFNLMAKTSGGEIECDLPLRFTSSGNISSGELIVGQASPTVKLTGRSSTIKILTR